MFNHQATINYARCPVCREEIDIPTNCNGYTTNRAVLDIVEELQKDASSDSSKSSTDVPKRPTDVLKCPAHNNAESVLLCIDCLEGLCLKCKKQGSHQGHKLEELADAKTFLKPKIDEQIKNEISLDAIMALITASAFSAAEASQAEADMKIIFDQVESIFAIWRGNQELVLTGFKQEAIDCENEIQAQREELKSLLEQKDIGAEELITKLKEPHSFEDPTQRFSYPKEAQDYSFAQHAHTLLESLQSVLHSKDTITSKFLKEALDVKAKDVPHPEKVYRNVAVDTSDISEPMLHAQDAFDVKPKDVQHPEKASWASSVTATASPKSGVKTTATAPGVNIIVSTSSGVKTTASATSSVQTTARATSEFKTTASATSSVQTTASATSSVQTTARATSEFKTTASASTGVKTTSETKTEVKIDKVVDKNGILLVKIQRDVIFYDLKAHTYKLCPQNSPRRDVALFSLKYCKDIKSQTSYRKHINTVKKYYSSFQ